MEMNKKKHLHVVFQRSVRTMTYLTLYHDLPISTDSEHTKLVFYFDVVYTLRRIHVTLINQQLTHIFCKLTTFLTSTRFDVCLLHLQGVLDRFWQHMALYTVSMCCFVNRCKCLCTNNCKFAVTFTFILMSHLLQLTDCWLKVGIRKVLRPATSAPVFFVSLCL